MNNTILCSTGAYIGQKNNFDHTLIPFYASRLRCDGLELMMLRAWYDDIGGRASYLAKSGVRFDVIHSDKEIGVLLSRNEDGDTAEALRLFEVSCRTGFTVGAAKLVLHLWGGYGTDRNIGYNISVLDRLLEISERYGLCLTVENIPCACQDPLTHWASIEELYPEARFIFDTRFGAFHRQLDEIFRRPWFENGKIVHMHISDFAGPPGDFTKLRPILFPNEGIACLNALLPRLKAAYHGSITLESPALRNDGSVDIEKINLALDLLRN
jgi:sugar phosphate isomerase/epimerase